MRSDWLLISCALFAEKSAPGQNLVATEFACTSTEPELLFIGDSKVLALATRAHIQGGGYHYLTPLAKVGQVPEQLAE